MDSGLDLSVVIPVYNSGEVLPELLRQLNDALKKLWEVGLSFMNNALLINFTVNSDSRGSLVAIEGGKTLDFTLCRIFYMYGLNPGTVRGRHANRETTMCFIALNGSCKISVDNGREKETFLLNDPSRGLICRPITWKEMGDFSSDCVLMAACNTNYNADEYIFDYETFKVEAIQ
jgi:dTDP-4-dehydrorhamnose 3,5-epimerase-like enzyme